MIRLYNSFLIFYVHFDKKNKQTVNNFAEFYETENYILINAVKQNLFKIYYS